MATDISAEIENLQHQIASLSRRIERKGKASGQEAYDYIAPRAQGIARSADKYGSQAVNYARRHPGSTVGAVLALGALAAFAAWCTTQTRD